MDSWGRLLTAGFSVFLLISLPMHLGHAESQGPVDVTFRVRIPSNTPSEDSVYVCIMPFHDWHYLAHVRMSPIAPGVFEARVSLPYGSFVRYAYDRWDERTWSEWKSTREAAPGNIKIDSRLLIVDATDSVAEDVVAAWADLPSSPAIGRLVGRIVDAETGEPLVDTNVTAGGVHIATDHDGYFKFSALPCGKQRVVAYRTLGDHKLVQTWVTIRKGEEAVLNIKMAPAKPVDVTFEVTLPDDTPDDAEIRMFGNIFQLGARIEGNFLNTPAMPTMNAPVMQRSGNRATLTLKLFDGMHVQYHYCLSALNLGSERNPDGRMVYRNLVVTPDVSHQRDKVICWRGRAMTRLSIYLTVPESTPEGVPIVLNYGPSYWMTKVSRHRWVFHVYGIPGGHFSYQYVLGDEMYGYELGHPKQSAVFKGQDTVIEDAISSWEYIPNDWEDTDTYSTWFSEPPRNKLPADFLRGFYPVDYWWQCFERLFPSTLDRIRAHNGTWVAVSNVWSYGTVFPTPAVESRPLLAHCPLAQREVILKQIREAHARGLQVLLVPQFNMELTPGATVSAVCSGHPDNWWEGWIFAARKLWIWSAQVAEEAKAEALLLPGHCWHAFPTRHSFSSPGEAQTFDKAVQALIKDVRSIYSGHIVIGYAGTDFNFPSLADWIGVTTYATGHPDLPPSAIADEWQMAYEWLFLSKLDPIYVRYKKPIVFYTIHIPSRTSPSDPTGELAQARQLKGLMEALLRRPWVIGTFSFSYEMIDTPLLISNGIRARLGEDVLKHFYEQ